MSCQCLHTAQRLTVSENTQDHTTQNGKNNAGIKVKGPCHKPLTAKKNWNVRYYCENSHNKVELGWAHGLVYSCWARGVVY